MYRQNLSVMFLGTASGGGPTETRNCSSLLCDFTNDYSIWLVDCAEGTLRQFQFQPQDGFKYRPSNVTKIFITHMHADHIMGIVPFLRCVLLPPQAGTPPAYTETPTTPKVEIYGPAGLRTFVRQIMKMTLTYTADTYTVHELLAENDPITPCDLPETVPQKKFDHNIANPAVMHVSEVRGSNLRADGQGFWKAIASGHGHLNEIEVDAGSIQHRDPCLGFVFRETGPPNRKIVILGDTYNASQIAPLCLHPSPSLLIHEATDCPIPPEADREGKLSKRAPEEVVKKAILRGHSVPAMAGTFAKQVGADHLVLNHISARFPVPRYPRDSRAALLKEIERQATEAWESTTQSAVAAQDFLRIHVPMSSPAVFLRPKQPFATLTQSSNSNHRQQIGAVSSHTPSSDSAVRSNDSDDARKRRR